MTARRIVAVGVLGMSAALALPARAAPPDPAQAAFDQGIADLEAGHFDKACPAIEQSYKLDPLPGTLFTLAECESKRGRTATALGRYEEYVLLYLRLPPDRKAKQGDREQIAQQAMVTLAQQVPEVTATLSPSTPPGTRILRDGAPVSDAAIGVPMRLDPGDHVFTLQPPGGPVTERRLSVKNGDKKAILLDLKLAPPPTPAVVKAVVPAPVVTTAPVQVPNEAHGPSGRRIAAFAFGGVGVAGLVVGAITGGLAVAKKSTVTADCGSGIGSTDSSACNQTGLSAANSMQTLGLVSTIGVVVGAAALGTGVVLFATEPKKTSTTSARGLTLGVTALGPAGAAASLKGAW